LRPRCCFTIHNIAFQGWLSPHLLAKIGLDPARMAQPHHMLDDSRPGFVPGQHDCSLLRGAVVFSERSTTVSPTYSREVLTSEFGMGAEVRVCGCLVGTGAAGPGVVNGEGCSET